MTTPALRLTAPHARLRARGRLGAGASVPLFGGALATAVTAAGSGTPSLWGDEAASALSAQRGLPSLLHEAAHVDAVHTVYYALLHLWVAAAGASPFALRLPSALATGAMVMGVIVLVRLCRPVASGLHAVSGMSARDAAPGASGWRMALVAGVVATALPRLDYAGVEARGYALSAACASWLCVLFVATATGRLPRRRGWLLLAVGLGAATALFSYSASLLLVFGVLLLAGGRRTREQLRAWAVSSAGALLLASPVLVMAMIERHQVAFLAQRSVSPADVLVSVHFLGTPPAATAGGALIAVALGAAASRRWRAVHGRLLVLALVWAALPGLLLVGTDPLLHNFSPRYLTFTSPAIAVLAAVGVEALWSSRRVLGIAALTGLLATSVPHDVYERTAYSHNGSDWAQLADVIGDHARPGQQLAFDETVRPSRRPVNALRLYPRQFAGLTTPQLITPWYATDMWHDHLMGIARAARQHRFTAQVVWAVETDFPGTGMVDDTGLPLLQDQGYRVVARWRLHTDLVYELRR